MSGPYDYVSNGIWHNQPQSQGQGQGQNQPQSPAKNQDQGYQRLQPQMMPNMNPRFNMPRNIPKYGLNAPMTVQSADPRMASNMSSNMTGVPMMSNMTPNTSFNMVPNGYGYYGGYGQSQHFNAHQYGPPS